MKRFALTICLAASLVFLLGVTAFAQDSLIVQSRQFAQNATGSVAIRVVNEQNLASIVVPLALRQITPGSFIATTGGLTFPANGRVPGGRLNLATGYLVGIKVAGRYIAEDGSCKNGGPGGFLTTVLPAYTGPWTAPAAVLFVCGWLDPNSDLPLPPGSDDNAGSLRLDLKVTGTPGFFEIDSTCTNPANHLLFADDQSASVTPFFQKGTEEIIPNACPNATALTPVPSTVGMAVNNQIGATDAESNPITFAMVAGSKGTVSASGLWSYTPVCADVPGFDVAVYVSDDQHAQDACDTVRFHVNVTPTALQVSGCGDVSVHFGALASKDVTVTGGCTPYVFSGGLPGSVDQNGHWTFETSCQDVGSQAVSITVTDAAQQTQTCNFNLSVTNATHAACTNPATITVQGSVNLGPATDADGDALVYTLVSGMTGWPGEGIVGTTYNSGTRPGGDVTDYHITFSVSDGCSEATCQITILFKQAFDICIVDTATGDAYAQAWGGENTTVGVQVKFGDFVGGFDFLICYDQTILRFISASRGPALPTPDWEYFTYRTGQFGGNCGGGCPNGYVKLIGLADMNDGHHATLFRLDGIIALLTFYVDPSATYMGLCAHVGFCSFECGDNAISSKTGDTLWIPQPSSPTDTLCGWSYGPDYNPVVCAQGIPGKGTVQQFLRFKCCSAICVRIPHDDRGDINQNGVANEIGDAVLFSNYFIYGLNSTFGSMDTERRKAQILATDVNNDGLTLTVADLVYLIRIITGDAQPFPPSGGGPKLSPYVNSVDVVSNVTDGALTVTTNASVDLGGAVLVYRFSDLTVGTPVLTAGSNLQLKSTVDRGELRILVSGTAAGAKVPAGLNNLITIPISGNGTIELAESQVSDNMGALLTVNAAKVGLPTSYALLQNYPNPFNAGTVIQFSLKDPSNWNLTIYNVAGQVVRTFNGNGSGNVSVSWDGTSANGSSVASGMYFYRLNAKEFTATKKMVLMK